MIVGLSLFALQKAPLNSDIQFLGLRSLMGVGGAYVLLMYFINVSVLRLLCHIIAWGQTELREVVFAGVLSEICGFIISEGLSRYIGGLSILPIYVVTVVIVMVLCDLSVSKSALIGLVYYAYQAAWLFLLKMLLSGAW